jgi:hypothetical protein
MKEEQRDRNNDKAIFGAPLQTIAVSAAEDIPVTTKHRPTQPYKQTTP